MRKIYSLFTVVILFFYACGGDDNSGALRYIAASSGYESYTLYVGSESGGIEVHTDSIKGRIDQIFPTTVFESYTNTTFVFFNNQILIEQAGSVPELSDYKFEDNSLYIYNNGDPIYFGDGSQTAIDVRQHYIAYKQPGDKRYNNISATPQKNIDKDKAVAQTPFETIENMKSEGDTLVWCTRISAFR